MWRSGEGEGSSVGLVAAATTRCRPVVSSIVWKSRDEVILLTFVLVGTDGIDDPLAALAIVEAGHRVGPSAHSTEAALNSVGGAEFAR